PRPAAMGGRGVVRALQQVPDPADRHARGHVPALRANGRAGTDPGHDPIGRRAQAGGAVAPEAPRDRARDLPRLSLPADHRLGLAPLTGAVTVAARSPAG